MTRNTIMADCGRCFTQGRQFYADPGCAEHQDPFLLVEHISCELVADWRGNELSIGQVIVVTEMDTTDNSVSCRVLEISDRVARVEIIQGRLIQVDPDDDDEWPFSGQPTGYRDEPVEPGPLVNCK